MRQQSPVPRCLSGNRTSSSSTAIHPSTHHEPLTGLLSRRPAGGYSVAISCGYIEWDSSVRGWSVGINGMPLESQIAGERGDKEKVVVVMVLVGEVSEKAEAENSQRNVSSRMAGWLACPPLWQYPPVLVNRGRPGK